MILKRHLKQVIKQPFFNRSITYPYRSGEPPATGNKTVQCRQQPA